MREASVADIADHAQALEEAHRAKSLMARVEKARRGAAAVEARPCANCYEPIPVERLRAVPQTELCVDCAATLEMVEERRGRR